MSTILITGANRGIGLEFVRQYADAGWQIIATCRDPAVAGELRSLAVADPNHRWSRRGNAGLFGDVSLDIRR